MKESLETYGEYDLTQTARKWNFKAFGRRTIDYIVRDNLFASLIRDARGHEFQRLTRKPPPWIQHAVEHLPKVQQQQATQLLVLDYLQRRSLARVMQPNVNESPDEEGVEVFGRVWDCTPMGALLERSNDDQEPVICGRPRVCPWCHARQVVEIYTAINRSLTTTNDQSHLVQLTVTLTRDEWKDVNIGDWFSHYQQRTDSPSTERGYFIQDAEARFVNAAVRQPFRNLARWLGMRDGLTTYQAGSHRSEHQQHDFRHIAGLLGVATCTKLELVEKLGSWRSRNGVIPPVRIDWLALPAKHPNALRLLLAGSSVGYLGKTDLPIFGMSTWGPEQYLNNGIPGVLSLQPTYLFGAPHWVMLWRYYMMTRSIPLYSSFGNWKKLLGEARKQKQNARLPDRRRRRRSMTPFQQANQGRSRDTQRRREELLEVARGLWPQVRQKAQGRPGRPPYRSLLKETLEARGCQVSIRDAAWLLGKLSA